MAEQSAAIKELKDANGKTVYPKTIVKAVYDETGKSLSTLLSELEGNQQTISSSSQPTDQSSGDVWIKEL